MDGHYVLVGNSAATLAAIDWIRRYDRSRSILVLNREQGPAYSRVALPYFVAGEMSLDDLLIRRRPDYAAVGAELVEDALVVAVDAEARQVVLADNRRVHYRKLLIGTGSVCVTPPIGGLDTIPAHYLWTLADAQGMRAAAERAHTAVVIGGGFIGMLTAEALRKLGIRLTVVEMTAQLLPQLLDGAGGSLFQRAVEDQGVSVRLGARVDSVAPAGAQVEVVLAGGDRLRADMIAVAAGVRPNLSCVHGGPCASDTGVLVDEYLGTNVPDVYAAGDCAQVRDFLSGERVIHAIWPTAVEQGRVAGANMAGAKQRYPGSLGMNVVELFNTTLAQIGRFKESPTDDVNLLGGGRGVLYRKVVVDRDGTVVGGMYVGDQNGVAEMGVLHGMVRRRAKWHEWERQRLPKFTYASLVHAAAHHG